MEIPYVSTKKNDQEVIFDLAKIKKGETVVDFGSGDGRLLVAAAKYGSTAIGYEINPFFIIVSKILIKLKKVEKKVIIKNENLWNADIAKANVIFIYALRGSMKKFESFIYENAKKDTRIIVNTNPFPAKKFQKKQGNIFLYII